MDESIWFDVSAKCVKTKLESLENFINTEIRYMRVKMMLWRKVFGLIKCKMCAIEIGVTRKLNKHIYNVHEEENYVVKEIIRFDKCIMCGNKFSMSGNLEKGGNNK